MNQRRDLSDLLVFEPGVARKKPENIRHRENPCPFCDVAGLSDIFRHEDDRIWLMNKYRTLRHTVQTVVIESSDHEGGPSRYDRKTNRRVFRFALECFAAMSADARFASVVMFKNFGPLSGGSLLHPHMQIVGLEDANAYARVSPENVAGTEVYRTEDVAVTLSEHPVMGLEEINVGIAAEGLGLLAPCGNETVAPRGRADEGAAFAAWAPAEPVATLTGNAARRVDALADCAQVIARYLLDTYHGGACTSYNLFFYPLGDMLWMKAMPRWVSSPYTIGYGLSQVSCAAFRETMRAELAPALEALGR